MPAKKKSKRTVFGRLRNIEACGSLYTFEMRKAEYDKSFNVTRSADIRYRRKASRTVTDVSFDEIINGTAFRFKVDGLEYNSTLSDDGVMVRQKGFKKWRCIPWASLVVKVKTGETTIEQFNLFPETQTK